MNSTYIDALKAKAETFRQTMGNILTKAQNENRSLTNDEQKDFETLEGKAKDALRSIELAQRAEALNPKEQTQDERGGLKVPNGTPVGNARENVLDKPWRSFGNFLQAVRMAGTPGGQVDPRLLETRAASGMSSTVDADGGFLIEKTVVQEIFKRAYDLSEVFRRCRKIPIGENSDGAKIPFIDETSRATGSRLGGVRVYRANQGDTVTSSKPKLGKIEIALEKLMGIGYATDELIRDAVLLGNIMMEAFAEETAFVADDEIFRGSGAGQCLGILNSPALVTVSKESGPQTADTIVYANVLKMWARMWARSRRNAVWFINQQAEPQLFQMSLAVGTGGAPVYLPTGGASGEPYGTLFGRPVVPIEQCSALGDLGDIVLADMTQYGVVERETEMAQSMHVRFEYDEQTFRTIYRMNGQPLWHSALTPYKGSDTLSPFVALQAR